ncbi:flagellar protein FlaG [Pseudomonas oryzihabitans]|uniref:flagellar protein FlaG n=1 Tax=Pseudomonas oryzihabitans TaxID=47885 RepID=UPI002893C117|nr:flagellar protein FlaG [Pseudomonas oryzihabitans]MDT3719862.1 flagellar protein FlaG [Pseudomonas oryzihabitans]
MSINLSSVVPGSGTTTPLAETKSGNVADVASAMANAVDAGAAHADHKGAAPVSPSREELEKTVKDLNSSAQDSHRNLEFSVDQDSGVTVVKVVNSANGELIRQIPSEVVVKLAADFKKSSNLLSEKA